MAQGQQKLVAWLIVGSVFACIWCSALSGVAGWVLGQDLGQRMGQAQARAELLPARGVLVIRVDRNGPADSMGIAPDDIIVSVDGEEVSDVPSLRSILKRHQPGDEISVTYRRDADEPTVVVRLDRFPGSDRAYLGIYYTARADDPGDL